MGLLTKKNSNNIVVVKVTEPPLSKNGKVSSWFSVVTCHYFSSYKLTGMWILFSFFFPSSSKSKVRVRVRITGLINLGCFCTYNTYIQYQKIYIWASENENAKFW